MEISSIRQFLVLAEKLNFTQAAEKCFVAQPTLSRNIASLEKELGVQLFIRNRRSVQLTQEGQTLLRHARRIVEEYEQLVAKAGEYHAGCKGELKIGYSSYPFILGVCMETIEKLGCLNPGIDVQVVFGSTRENFLDLLRDRLDGVFVLDCGIAEKYPELRCERVAPSRAYALVCHNHPLAQRESIALHELAGQPMIMINREDNPDLFDFRLQHYLQSGIRMQDILYAPTIKDLMVLVSRGLGVAVLNEDGHLNTIGAIKPVAVSEGIPPLQLSFVWKKQSGGQCMRRFVESLRRVCKEKQDV